MIEHRLVDRARKYKPIRETEVAGDRKHPHQLASTFGIDIHSPVPRRIHIMQCTAKLSQRSLHPPAQRREDFVSGQNSASRLDRVLGPRRPVLRRAIAGIASDRISVTGTGVRRIGRRALISIARTTWVRWP